MRFTFGDELENLRSFPYSRFTNTAAKTPPFSLSNKVMFHIPGYRTWHLWAQLFNVPCFVEEKKCNIRFRKNSNFLLIDPIKIIKLKFNIANLEVLGNGGLIIYCIKIVSSGGGVLHTSMSVNAEGPCVLLSLSLPLFP